MNRISHSIAALLPALASALLIGCASQPPKPWVPPSLVLILPPENTTAAAGVESMVYPMVYERMVNRGYYCISPELARGIFNTNKFEDAGRINALPPQKFKEVFGADAVLKVRVTEYEPIAEANVDAMVADVPAGDYRMAGPESQASGVEQKP